MDVAIGASDNTDVSLIPSMADPQITIARPASRPGQLLAVTFCLGRDVKSVMPRYWVERVLALQPQPGRRIN